MAKWRVASSREWISLLSDAVALNLPLFTLLTGPIERRSACARLCRIAGLNSPNSGGELVMKKIYDLVGAAVPAVSVSADTSTLIPVSIPPDFARWRITVTTVEALTEEQHNEFAPTLPEYWSSESDKLKPAEGMCLGDKHTYRDSNGRRVCPVSGSRLASFLAAPKTEGKQTFQLPQEAGVVGTASHSCIEGLQRGEQADTQWDDRLVRVAVAFLHSLLVDKNTKISGVELMMLGERVAVPCTLDTLAQKITARGNKKHRLLTVIDWKSGSGAGCKSADAHHYQMLLMMIAVGEAARKQFVGDEIEVEGVLVFGAQGKTRHLALKDLRAVWPSRVFLSGLQTALDLCVEGGPPPPAFIPVSAAIAASRTSVPPMAPEIRWPHRHSCRRRKENSPQKAAPFQPVSLTLDFANKARAQADWAAAAAILTAALFGVQRSARSALKRKSAQTRVAVAKGLYVVEVVETSYSALCKRGVLPSGLLVAISTPAITFSVKPLTLATDEDAEATEFVVKTQCVVLGFLFATRCTILGLNGTYGRVLWGNQAATANYEVPWRVPFATRPWTFNYETSEWFPASGSWQGPQGQCRDEFSALPVGLVQRRAACASRLRIFWSLIQNRTIADPNLAARVCGNLPCAREGTVSHNSRRKLVVHPHSPLAAALVTANLLTTAQLQHTMTTHDGGVLPLCVRCGVFKSANSITVSGLRYRMEPLNSGAVPAVAPSPEALSAPRSDAAALPTHAMSEPGALGVASVPCVGQSVPLATVAAQEQRARTQLTALVRGLIACAPNEEGRRPLPRSSEHVTLGVRAMGRISTAVGGSVQQVPATAEERGLADGRGGTSNPLQAMSIQWTNIRQQLFLITAGLHSLLQDVIATPDLHTHGGQLSAQVAITSSDSANAEPAVPSPSATFAIVSNALGELQAFGEEESDKPLNSLVCRDTFVRTVVLPLIHSIRHPVAQFSELDYGTPGIVAHCIELAKRCTAGHQEEEQEQEEQEGEEEEEEHALTVAKSQEMVHSIFPQNQWETAVTRWKLPRPNSKSPWSWVELTKHIASRLEAFVALVLLTRDKRTIGKEITGNVVAVTCERANTQTTLNSLRSLREAQPKHVLRHFVIEQMCAILDGIEDHASVNKKARAALVVAQEEHLSFKPLILADSPLKLRCLQSRWERGSENELQKKARAASPPVVGAVSSSIADALPLDVSLTSDSWAPHQKEVVRGAVQYMQTLVETRTAEAEQRAKRGDATTELSWPLPFLTLFRASANDTGTEVRATNAWGDCIKAINSLSGCLPGNDADVEALTDKTGEEEAACRKQLQTYVGSCIKTAAHALFRVRAVFHRPSGRAVRRNDDSFRTDIGKTLSHMYQVFVYVS